MGLAISITIGYRYEQIITDDITNTQWEQVGGEPKLAQEVEETSL